MEEKLKRDVEAMVTEIFSKKEEAEMRELIELELKKAANTIEDLTSVLETKKTEFVEVDTNLGEANEKIGNLETELEAARKEIETSTEKLAETEKVLEEKKKDEVANVRMSELEEAKVTRTDKDSQVAKIREMSNEDFVAYKEELVSIRQSVVAELEANQANTEANSVEEETPSTDTNAGEEGSENPEAEGSVPGESASDEGTEEEIPPANVDPGEAMAAALNMETAAIGDDILSKYTDLGNAMADNMKKQTEV